MSKSRHPATSRPGFGNSDREKAAPAANAATRRLAGARTRYAEEWSAGNARRFSADGLYRWMARALPGETTVLEVGIGDGSGTIALLEAGHAVISVDENPACLRLAERRLLSAGAQVAYETREIAQPDGIRYRIRYSAPALPVPDCGALLIEGDILDDPALIHWLGDGSAVDAVVCWLMGTYLERAQNSTIARLGIRTPWDYRATVHRSVCGVADTILPSDGILHFVDRGDVPESEAGTEHYRTYYRSQAMGTALTMGPLDYIRYHEPAPDTPAAIRLTAAETGRDPDRAQKALISVIFRKR